LESLWLKKAKQAQSAEISEKYRAAAYRYYLITEKLGWVQDPDANTRGSIQ
jgi:hypothetical protein